MALSGDKITKTVAGRLRLLDKTKSKRGKWNDEDHTAAATEWLKTCMIDGMTEVLGEDHRDLINVDLRDSDVWRETEDD